MTAEGMLFPRPSDGKMMVSFDWVPIRYRNVISVLKNPFYAGAYAYGKTEKRTQIVDGRVGKSYGHRKSPWIMIRLSSRVSCGRAHRSSTVTLPVGSCCVVSVSLRPKLSS
ncbi:recombinase family protein [Novosphingobium sp. HK4-1]|uniref:Recombinase family protein n=1 Tax=Novosphingobium mangrovi (ex Huang et al. 2023) TaxID=2976432 RepID=A0ABT2I989_9SPHN|nr:recombinase family protein [Novosphingobium mangrovi (ex Huang et al. 2023)]